MHNIIFETSMKRAHIVDIMCHCGNKSNRYRIQCTTTVDYTIIQTTMHYLYISIQYCAVVYTYLQNYIILYCCGLQNKRLYIIRIQLRW